MHNAVKIVLRFGHTRCKSAKRAGVANVEKRTLGQALCSDRIQKRLWSFPLWSCSAENVARRSPMDWPVEALANGLEAEMNGSEKEGTWRGDWARLLRLFASSSNGEPSLLCRSSGSGTARLEDEGGLTTAVAAFVSVVCGSVGGGLKRRCKRSRLSDAVPSVAPRLRRRMRR